MGAQERVLLVSPTVSLSMSLTMSLRSAGYEVTAVRTFQAARAQLQHRPALVITELKLAEYNGLHLALRARTAGIPAIVVADRSFAADVDQAGAVRVSPERVLGDDLPAAITRCLQDASTEAIHPWFTPVNEVPPSVRVALTQLPTTPDLLH